MQAIQCDQCDRSAMHHFVEIVNGEQVEQHLCAAHAAPLLSAALPMPQLTLGQMVINGQIVDLLDEAATVSALTQFRALVALMRRLGREPTPDELGKEMQNPGPDSTQDPADPKLKSHIRYLEKMIEFVEQHQRLPTGEQEFPFSEYEDL